MKHNVDTCNICVIVVVCVTNCTLTKLHELHTKLGVELVVKDLLTKNLSVHNSFDLLLQARLECLLKTDRYTMCCIELHTMSNCLNINLPHQQQSETRRSVIAE